MRKKKSHRKAAESSKARYENAWDDTVGYGPEAWDVAAAIREGVIADRRRTTSWNTFRRFSHTRTGKTVILAPVFGALGALLYLKHKT